MEPPPQVLTHLVHAAQRRLLGAGDQVGSNADHVDLVLLNTQHGASEEREQLFHWSRRHALTFSLSSTMLSSQMLLVPTMISESKAATENLRRSRKRKGRDSCACWCRSPDGTDPDPDPDPDPDITTTGGHGGGDQTQDNHITTTRLSESHSLLPAEAEDAAHVQRLPAEVAAVQAQPQGLEAQFAQSQGHGAEVQQAAATG